MCKRKKQPDESKSVTVKVDVLRGGATLHEPSGEATQNIVAVDKKTRWRGIGITVASNVALGWLGYALSPVRLAGVIIGIVVGSIIGVLLFLKIETGITTKHIISKWSR